MSDSVSPTAPYDEEISLELGSEQKYLHWEREELLPATSDVLATLPLDAYPFATLKDYAHVLNALARHWNDQPRFVEAAGQFLRRGDWEREGFPRAVFFEILELVACNGSLAELGILDLRRINLKPDAR